MAYLNAISLAKRLAKPLVVFDIEHTGGLKQTRAITEFAAYVQHPDGVMTSFTSLVKPFAGAVFSPIVSRITKIYPSTVKNAPTWPEVYADFIAKYADAIWVGFNSRASDTPIIVAECLRHDIHIEPFKLQLDVMRAPSGKGSLATRTANWLPDLDTTGAHRAAKDALMTLALLDAVLPKMSDADLTDQGLLVKPVLIAPPPIAILAASGSGTFVVTGEIRHGAPWRDGEAKWAAIQFKLGTELGPLAASIGRTERSLAFVLHRYGLLSPELCSQHKVA